MTQQIDPIRLKAAAEHLEWVLNQHRASQEVQDLLEALLPLLRAAQTGAITTPIERYEVPGSYDFGDGVFRPYKSPNVDDAYTKFRTELRGGVTEEERQLHEQIESYRRSRMGSEQ